jgi:DNA-binding NarL/FixJ family response regulator
MATITVQAGSALRVLGDRDDRLHGALTAIRVLTTFDDDESVFAALRAGASGFLVKDVEPEELLRAVRVVARGDALLAPSVTRDRAQLVVLAYAHGLASPSA